MKSGMIDAEQEKRLSMNIEYLKYFAELAKTAQAVWNLYHPDKINYATFGDGVPHVHVHVVPKYKGGLQWGEAFHDDVEKVLLSEEEYQEMAKALREEICKPA